MEQNILLSVVGKEKTFLLTFYKLANYSVKYIFIDLLYWKMIRRPVVFS